MRSRDFAPIVAAVCADLVHAEPRNRGGLKTIDDAAQAFPEGWCAKVDQQTNLFVSEFEICQKLLGIVACKLFDALYLNNNLIIYDKIQSKSFFERYALIFDTNDFLRLDAKARRSSDFARMVL